MLLFNGECEPVTREIAFFECDCRTIASVVRAWQEQRPWWQGIRVTERELVGDLRTVLDRLLPLTDVETSRLLVPTTGRWTACFNNDWLGTGAAGCIDLQARDAHCRAVRAVCDPKRPTVILDVHEADGQLRRSIYVCKDGRQCRYYTYGKPFEFEQTDRYSARWRQDRFTPEILKAYLVHLGIDAFSPEFYAATPSNPARMIVPHWRAAIYALSAVGWAFGARRRRFLSFEAARMAKKRHYELARISAERSRRIARWLPF